ncbi:MAG TPA: metallophosphoesterase [Bryobacteraceae bacterium]|nr:metallophosphoesterase [Bryobacteraceae bacterium]
MPHLSLPPSSRRAFLQTAFGGVVFAMAPGGSEPWALLSDIHIPEDPATENRGFHLHDNMKRVLEGVAQSPVRGMVISGDLARTSGKPGDYRALRQFLEPTLSRMPVAMALGNHDDRANFLEVFAEHPGASAMVKGKHVLVIEAGPVRLIVLDSQIFVNRVPGLLGKAQRTWLDEYLRTSSNTPTLLFVHHNLEDNDGALLDSDRFLAVVRPHRKVKAVFYGHTHRYAMEQQADGLHLINVPATAYTFDAAEPVGWLEAAFTGQGAELTLRAVGGNREKDGKTVAVRWRA